VKYLQGYPAALLEQVRPLMQERRMMAHLLKRYPQAHVVRNERALVDYVGGLKACFMKSAPPLAKVAWDAKLHVVRNALGTHTAVSRVQGGQLRPSARSASPASSRKPPSPF
jgi:predicted metal-dependent hydrolase